MFKTILAALATALIVFVTYLLMHLGLFKPVTFEQTTAPAIQILYKDHVGSYYKINEKIQAVETWAKQNQISCALSFGEYFDDPSVVEEARLRSRGGCIVEGDPANKPTDFGYALIPERKVILAHFSGSPSIGPYKVYNSAEDYRLENRLVQEGPVMEVYEVISDKEMHTRYYFPLKQ
jgi:AraC family transcriptional regulator